MPPDHLFSSNNPQQAHPSVLPDLAQVREVDSREREVEEIVGDDGESNDEGLGDLDSVDSSEDIDRVGGEGGEEGHVDVVERTWIGGEGSASSDDREGPRRIHTEFNNGTE